MIGMPYFGMNNALSMNTTKNAMIAPGSYGGDPMTYGGQIPGSIGGPNGLDMANFLRSSEGMAPLSYGGPLPGAGPLSIADFSASMAPYRRGGNPYAEMQPFGNHYTRYLMGGGQRQNRLYRPYSQRPNQVNSYLEQPQPFARIG